MQRPQLLPSSGPFSARVAYAAGLTPHALRGSAWRQLTRGVWIAVSDPVDRQTWVDAARLVLPVDAVLSGPSAASEYGIDVRRADDLLVHVAFDRQVPRRRPGVCDPAGAART
jgi:hypothetical protein